MSGRHPSRPRPPWETQEQPLYTPDDTWYGRARGPRVVIKPHARSAGGGGRQGGYTEPQRESRRRVTLVSVAVGLAAAVGIAAAVVQLTHVGWGQAPAPATQAAATVTTPALTPTPTTSASKSGAGAAQTAYVLGAPATAGGYTLTTPTLPAIQAVGSAGAVALMTAVKAAGGKPRSDVSGEYLISGDQALGYTGYTGTFSPAAVVSAFKAGTSSSTTEAAGPHGGELACGEVTAMAASGTATPGTACVWATTTTVGMVEFFAGSDLETVLHSKADSDTLKFRADVETLKGAAQP